VYVGHGGSMPGYVAALLVHRPTRTAVVGFANSYGFPITGLGRRLLTTVLDAEPALPRPWRPATVAPAAGVAELIGRWWWMGVPLDLRWDAGDLVAHVRGERVSRFAAEGTDRWRGRSGPENGEVLSVLRDDSGRALAVDIATFVFTRSPDEVP